MGAIGIRGGGVFEKEGQWGWVKRRGVYLGGQGDGLLLLMRANYGLLWMKVAALVVHCDWRGRGRGHEGTGPDAC